MQIYVMLHLDNIVLAVVAKEAILKVWGNGLGLKHKKCLLLIWVCYFAEYSQVYDDHHQHSQEVKSFVFDKDIARLADVWLNVQLSGTITLMQFTEWVHNKVMLVMHEMDALGSSLIHMCENQMRVVGEKGKIVDLDLVQMQHKLLLVPVFHESVFSTNDSKWQYWKKKGRYQLAKKSKGKGLMCLKFVCPCHGEVKLLPSQIVKRMDGMPFKNTKGEVSMLCIIHDYGKDGFWMGEMLNDQIENKFLPTFMVLHGNWHGQHVKMLVMLNNTDMLLMCKVISWDNGKKAPRMCTGWFM
ncbi:hypothetical protein AMAG_19491 [Allomyces macrogynus ATCC 38327]|uniref:Uncharacterized protein n=1 Tax=Allomyces macrogynus (strain ATCC 38327) TaxID=578462 RepID=A0A0L0SSL7_ALLM3|nr:hypothetical protein AMAG_19491 [Allomyces macrogynus ATCC 38327]|eukprot:KNE65553.1 hypothetical protein AMAG_19491 [Allomyces macrogynus ATCC 38327]